MSPTDPADDLRCDWSPAGEKIAFASNRNSIDGIRNDEVYVMNSDGSQPVRLTFAARSDISPDWSPNGECIAFESNRDLNAEIYVMNADGTDQIRLTNSPFQDSKPTWSPDGNKIAFHHRGANFPSGHLEVYTMDQDGTNIFQVTFTASPGFSGFPNWGRRSQGQ